MYKTNFIVILFFILSLSIFPQTNAKDQTTDQKKEPLSEGYKEIKLGMTMEQVKSILNKSFDFNPLREEELVVRFEPDTEIITTEGKGYIISAYFHFHKDKLFQILLKISEKKVGYYLLLKDLTKRFGNPTKLNPKKASWENDKVKIIIEKPCTLKYQYIPVWNEILSIKDSSSDLTLKKLREDFIKDL